LAIGGEQHQAEGWARQALERMQRDGIAPAPEHYAVYYTYFAGTNPNLKMAIDLLWEQHGALTHQQCADLYTTHLGLDNEHKLLRETTAAIETEISNALKVIDQATGGAQKFGQTLTSFSGELTTPKSLEQIREVVNKVANETRVIAQQNERLQSQLAHTTDQLSEMRYNLDQVHKESQIDPLTEVGNRKFFNQEMARALKEAVDTDTPLTLLIVDIDHFKKFNDTHGHLVGDQVLRLVARTLVENLKGRDVIARYGGEEFVILLPQTRVNDGEKVANQLRGALGTKHIRRRSTNETLGVVTVSIGAAQYNPGEESETFIARADTGLYKAKNNGRNQVVIETVNA
jgi:diguanylate cyclase